jgi:hypothetical protein
VSGGRRGWSWTVAFFELNIRIPLSDSSTTTGVVSGGRRGVSKRKVFGSACLRRGVKEIDRQAGSVVV